MNRTTWKSLIAAATLVAASASIPGTARAQEFAPYTKIVTIAVVAPLSGPERQLGIDLSAGVQQAVDDANEFRGLTDFGWVTHSFDDQADPGIAMQQAQFALVDPTTAFVVGHVGGQETLLALPTYRQHAIPVIMPTVLAALTQQGYDNVFRICPSDLIEGQLDARYADRDLKAKKVAVVYEELDYGLDTATGFLRYVQPGKGMQAKDFSVDVELKNVSAAVGQVKTYAPDLLFVAGKGSDMAKVIKGLRDAGVDAPIVAAQSLLTSYKDLGKAAEGMTISRCMPPVDRMATAQRILSRYQAHHGNLSDYAVFGYVAAQIAMAAAKQAQSADPRLLDRQLSVGNFQTILGPVQFQRGGDPLAPNVYLYKVSGDTLKYVDSVYPNPLIVK